MGLHFSGSGRAASSVSHRNEYKYHPRQDFFDYPERTEDQAYSNRINDYFQSKQKDLQTLPKKTELVYISKYDHGKKQLVDAIDFTVGSDPVDTDFKVVMNKLEDETPEAFIDRAISYGKKLNLILKGTGGSKFLEKVPFLKF